jgi:hypothetical protein
MAKPIRIKTASVQEGLDLIETLVLKPHLDAVSAPPDAWAA